MELPQSVKDQLGDTEEDNRKSEGRRNLILASLQITLEAYNLNLRIKPEEVYSFLNYQELKKYDQSLERNLLSKIQTKRSSAELRKSKSSDLSSQSSRALHLDLGHYPLSPWLNQVDNNSQYATMKLDQAKKYDSFNPPRAREDLLVIQQAECSSNFYLNQF